MNERAEQIPDSPEQEPRWHAIIAVVAVGGLYTALPSSLIVGPRWLFFAIVIALLVPTVISHVRQNNRLNRILSLTISGVITLGMMASVVLLISALPEHKENSTELLISAATLWLTNILVFALWYWRLDADGPHGREKTAEHTDGAFLFPQMTMMPRCSAICTSAICSPHTPVLRAAFSVDTALHADK